jgi:hypothetical protein
MLITPVAVELEFVEPIADRQLLYSERRHWFNERKVIHVQPCKIESRNFSQ